MDFEYVSGWYSQKTKQVKPLGGFTSVKLAKEFTDSVDTLFWGNGFLFVDSPEGVHIKGMENVNKTKWYSPEEVKNDAVKLFLLKNNHDYIVPLYSFLPYDDYIKFTQGQDGVFKEQAQQSVKHKLSVNKGLVDSKENHVKEEHQKIKDAASRDER